MIPERRSPFEATQARLLIVCVLIGLVILMQNLRPGGRLYLGGPVPIELDGANEYRQKQTDTALESDKTADANAYAQIIDSEGIWVHLLGEVNQPGVYRVPSDTRLVNLLDHAEGPTSRANLDELNLAAVLQDGQKITVSRREVSEELQDLAESGGDAASSININEADAEALQHLQGIGPVLADRIIEYRKIYGPFSTVEQMQEVKGIGEKTLERLKPSVSVGD